MLNPKYAASKIKHIRETNRISKKIEKILNLYCVKILNQSFGYA